MKQKTVLMFALCVFMCVCGCTAKPMDEMGRTDENSDMLSSATENAASRMAPAMQEKVEWPTAKEIRASRGLLAGGCSSGARTNDLLQRRCAGYGGILGDAE